MIFRSSHFSQAFAAAGFALALGLFAIRAADAQGPHSSVSARESVRAGRLMAQTYCSGCHAIGAKGRSHHPDARPFRTLSERYPIDDLAEGFAEGISVGHPDMPEWRFEPDQIRDLLAYLKSIQMKRRAGKNSAGSSRLVQ